MVIVNKAGEPRPRSARFVSTAASEEEAMAIGCAQRPGAWIEPPYREGHDSWEVWALADSRAVHPAGRSQGRSRHLSSVVPASRRPAWSPS